MGFIIFMLAVIGLPVGFFLASLIGQIILVKSSSYEEITGIRFLKFFFGFGNHKVDTKQGFSLFPFVEAQFRSDVEIDEERARKESLKGLIIIGIVAIIYFILFIVLFKPSPALLNSFSVGAFIGVIIALIMIVISAFKAKQKDDFRIRNIGFVFQEFKLLDKMTVEDNLNVLALEDIDVSSAKQIFSDLGIARKLKAKASTLSGGEKQRVAIARALVKKPSIVLADEPTGNLNYAIGEQVIRQLLDACRGKTLLCVTHDERLCPMFDRVLRLEEYATVKEAENNA